MKSSDSNSSPFLLSFFVSRPLWKRASRQQRILGRTISQSYYLCPSSLLGDRSLRRLVGRRSGKYRFCARISRKSYGRQREAASREERQEGKKGKKISVATYRIGKPIEPFILFPLLFPSLESVGSLVSICTHGAPWFFPLQDSYRFLSYLSKKRRTLISFFFFPLLCPELFVSSCTFCTLITPRETRVRTLFFFFLHHFHINNAVALGSEMTDVNNKSRTTGVSSNEFPPVSRESR